MRVLKTATCDTLSVKSTLTYQIRCDPDSRIHLRIIDNTGGDFLSGEWISYDDFQAALKTRHEGSDLSTYLLIPLFRGKSLNTPSFLLASLKHLKLIRTLPGKQRLHEQLASRPFLDEVGRLMSSGPAKPREGDPTVT